MRNDTYLYTDGLDAARRSGQIALWRASHQANIACKKAIEDSIRQGFERVAMADSAPTTEVGHSAPLFLRTWATR